jgi:hypothetical protein
MDSKIGLDYIVESKEYTTKLGSGMGCIFNFSQEISRHEFSRNFVIILRNFAAHTKFRESFA